MKLLVVHVTGLSNGLAKRPDLAASVSSLIETGAYAPIFPEFPALDAPARAALVTGARAQEHGILSNHGAARPPAKPPFWSGSKKTISSIEWGTAENAETAMRSGASDVMLVNLTQLGDALRRAGPRDPSMPSEFKAVDARLGSLAKAAKAAGAEIVVVSGVPIYPVLTSVDLAPALQQKGWAATVDGQIAYCRGNAAEIARYAKSLDRGIKVLSNRDEKSLYHVDHPDAGDVVLISPPNKAFVPGVRGASGHLPVMPDDYGVFVSSVPVPSLQGRPFIPLPRVAGILADLLSTR